jgi:hypothetical protein
LIQHKLVLPAALLLFTLTSAGCSQVRQAVGVDKAPPNEFEVSSRAPLNIPPDYALRPPLTGGIRQKNSRPSQQARQSVFNSNQSGVTTASLERRSAEDGRSLGELALLKEANALDADDGIRNQVDRESMPVRKKKRTFADALMFWKKDKNTGDPLDAQSEADRLGAVAPVNRRVEVPPPPPRQVIAQAPTTGSAPAPAQTAPTAAPAPVEVTGPLVPADPNFADLIMTWDDPDVRRSRPAKQVRRVTIERKKRSIF